MTELFINKSQAPAGYRSLLKKLLSFIESSIPGYRLSLLMKYGTTRPYSFPGAPWHNAVLKNQAQVNFAVNSVRELGLPPLQYPPKSWDSLASLDLILNSTTKEARILDAGGEIYSMILPWLFLYGYRNLEAGNLVFQKPLKKGPIIYQPLDITKSGLDSSAYDAVTCLSVIEHGVNLSDYFSEMSRILKPGGILITSADYFETKIDSREQIAYNVPIKIFTGEEITEALKIANSFGLQLISPLDLSSNEKVIYWEKYNLSYTFIIFSLRKSLNI